MNYPKLKNYRMLRKICRKFCFDIYEVESFRERERFFIKVLNETSAPQEHIRKLFFQSAQMSNLISHENAAKAFKFNSENDVCFIVSEALRGKSVTLHIHEEYPAALLDCTNSIIKMTKVLRNAHLNGVVHGLLNPDTIYIDEDYLKIDNFGFNWLISRGGIEDAEAVYLSYFIAPETYVPGVQIDGRVDIYSLGAIFLLMLIEDFAFNGKAESNVKQPTLLATIPHIKKVYPENYPLLEHILTKCLHKVPQKRYLNCKELLSDLAKITAERPGSRFSKTSPPQPTKAQNKLFP